MVAGWIGGLFSEVPDVAGLGSDDATSELGAAGRVNLLLLALPPLPWPSSGRCHRHPLIVGLLSGEEVVRDGTLGTCRMGGVHRDDAVLVGRRGWRGRVKVVASFALVGLLRLAS